MILSVLLSHNFKLQITKEGCGETKSCYSEPENCKASSNCDYLVTIKPLRGGDEGEVAEEVEFEISANRRWTSIGFNKNKKMVKILVALFNFKSGFFSLNT